MLEVLIKINQAEIKMSFTDDVLDMLKKHNLDVVKEILPVIERELTEALKTA